MVRKAQVRADDVMADVTRREEVAPQLAKQVKQRVRKQSDGGIHAVSHTIGRSRKQEAAASKEVATPPKRRWQRPSVLPVLELAGYHLEYVRRDNRNRGDYANFNAHVREGWEPCRPSDFDIAHLPTQRLTSGGEVIGNDDTILMKITEEMWQQRCAHYNAIRDAATNAVNRQTPSLDVSHPSMPIVDTMNRSDSGFKRMRARRPVSVAGD